MGLWNYLFPTAEKAKEAPEKKDDLSSLVDSVVKDAMDRKILRDQMLMTIKPPSGGTSGKTYGTPGGLSFPITPGQFQKVTPNHYSPAKLEFVDVPAEQHSLRIYSSNDRNFRLFAKLVKFIEPEDKDGIAFFQLETGQLKNIYSVAYFLYLKGFHPVGKMETSSHFNTFIAMIEFFKSFEQINNTENDKLWDDFKSEMLRLQTKDVGGMVSRVPDFITSYSFQDHSGRIKEFAFRARL